MNKITKNEAIELAKAHGVNHIERPGCGWVKTDWNDLRGYYIEDKAEARAWWWGKSVMEQAYCDIAFELDRDLGEFARGADMSNIVRHLRQRAGLTQKNFSSRYGIPMRTYQGWETGEATPPEYVVQLLSRAVAEDFMPKDTKPVDPAGEL